MNSSGLFSPLFPIMYQEGSRTAILPGEVTMSLDIFLMLCILGIDFMIYVFFQWIYGDKRSAIARQVAACRKTLNEESSRPFVVTSEKAANVATQSPHRCRAAR
jgi:hypothetical protein